MIFFYVIRPPRSPTLFPYTTLFRSCWWRRRSSSRGEELPNVLRLCGPPVGIHGERLRAARLGDRVERSEEHTSELQSRRELVCRLLLEKKNDLRYRAV